MNDVCNQVLSGDTVLMIDGYQQAIAISTKDFQIEE